MKRLIALLLALTMTFGLGGCGDAELNEALVNGAIDVLTDIVIDSTGDSATTDDDDAPAPSSTVQSTTSAASKPAATTQATTTAPATSTSAAATTTAESTTATTTTATAATKATTTTTAATQAELLDEEGWYYSADDVALYLWTYGYLPGNFITKADARKLGWEGGSVEDYAPGCAIGGDKFGNREELLPTARGRQYYECDIDTNGRSSRGAKRLVFSNDGLIYYTDDHYESFTLLYGEE